MDFEKDDCMEREKAGDRGLQRIVRVERALILLEQYLKSVDPESLRFAAQKHPASGVDLNNNAQR